MEMVLNKIIDIISDKCDGVLFEDFDDGDFLYGYIRALVDSGKMTQKEATMISVFYRRLVEGRVFLWKED